MQVGYGIAGGSGDGIVHAGGSNGIPMVQADFSKGTYKAHMIAAGTCDVGGHAAREHDWKEPGQPSAGRAPYVL